MVHRDKVNRVDPLKRRQVCLGVRSSDYPQRTVGAAGNCVCRRPAALVAWVACAVCQPPHCKVDVTETHLRDARGRRGELACIGVVALVPGFDSQCPTMAYVIRHELHGKEMVMDRNAVLKAKRAKFFRTADGVEVTDGARLFNYYDCFWVEVHFGDTPGIERPSWDGWFETRRVLKDGTVSPRGPMLNGERMSARPPAWFKG